MKTSMVIQQASKVATAAVPLEERTPDKAIEKLIKAKVEACSEYGTRVVCGLMPPFVRAVHYAFARHRPLVLSPDMFWLLITQGFAGHVNAHSDEYRSLFVKHEGRKEIRVRRNDFIKGSPENPWSEVFASFSSKVLAVTGVAGITGQVPRGCLLGNTALARFRRWCPCAPATTGRRSC